MPIPLPEPIVETPSPVTYDALLFRHVEIHSEPQPDGSLQIRLMVQSVPYSTESGATKDAMEITRRNLDLEQLAAQIPMVAYAMETVLTALPQIEPHLVNLENNGQALPLLP